MQAFIVSGSLYVIIFIVFIIIKIICLFFFNIILFESIIIAIVAGYLANYFLHIHPVLCVLAGIFVLIGLYCLSKTKVGFWIIGGLMSLIWGLVAVIIMEISKYSSEFWLYTSWALSSLAFLALHLIAKKRVFR